VSDSFKRVEDLNSPILLENDKTWSLTLDRSRHLATVACKIVWWTHQTTAIPSHHPRRTTVYQSKTTEITSSSTRKCTKLFQNRNANYSNMKMKWITGYLRITNEMKMLTKLNILKYQDHLTSHGKGNKQTTMLPFS
jgi:hypothetical protein